MAKKIKLQFYDKTYTIEYANRIEVKEYFAKLGNIKNDESIENGLKALVILLKAGLIEHHKDNMPSDSDLERWATSIPNADKFYKTLMSMVQEVISVISDDTKNLKWEVEEA